MTAEINGYRPTAVTSNGLSRVNTRTRLATSQSRQTSSCATYPMRRYSSDLSQRGGAPSDRATIAICAILSSLFFFRANRFPA